VPVLTMMLAEAVNNCRIGPLKDFTMSDRDRYELRSPAVARLRQGDNPGARRRQGDQAADPVRPYRAHSHALRGDQA